LPVAGSARAIALMVKPAVFLPSVVRGLRHGTSNTLDHADEPV
jgi:hypothetical protein